MRVLGKHIEQYFRNKIANEIEMLDHTNPGINGFGMKQLAVEVALGNYKLVNGKWESGQTN